MKKLEPLSLDGIKTYSLSERQSKVSQADFGAPWEKSGSFKEFIKRLPHILAADTLRDVAAAWVKARRAGRPVLLGMGAHPIKVGLSPVLIDLMQRGLITGVALNGACIIHDAEVAMVGRTSEDVDEVLGCGAFGMAKETAEFLNGAIAWGGHNGLGLGEAVGRRLLESNFPHLDLSLVAKAAALEVPLTVHVAVGTDIIHLHPSVVPEALGAATHRDFRLFAALVSELDDGVFINLGSAVIIPEVFLKAITLARNLGHKVAPLTTVNLDFMQHYRPLTNVVRRPTAGVGRGFALTGHHEIMLPILAALVIEEMEESSCLPKSS
ncbi:MAG: GSU2086 family protein [Desulfobaccales bacterium]